MTDTQHPPAWHPDPSRQHQQRYWDGQQWTEHVSDNGVVSEDHHGQIMANSGQTVSTGLIDGESFGQQNPSAIQAQVAKAQTGSTSIYDAMSVPSVPSEEVPAPEYNSTIFTENIIVVNQKAKIFELTTEYGIFDQHGNQIGFVRQIGQSSLKKVARLLTNVDAMMTHKLEITDMSSNVLLRVTKPRHFIKGKLIITNMSDQELGSLEIVFRVGKMHMKILSGSQQLGMVYAENFRAWDFRIEDNQQNRIASVTKTWEGFAKAMFTTADNYVLQIHEELQDPLKSLVLASCLAIDLIIKQNNSAFV